MLQNAAPDGPAAFMFTEIVMRPYRWSDDGWRTADKLMLGKQCLYMDQDAYNDVLPDMASGYMLFPKAWGCLDPVCLLCVTGRLEILAQMNAVVHGTLCVDCTASRSSVVSTASLHLPTPPLLTQQPIALLHLSCTSVLCLVKAALKYANRSSAI